MAWRSLYCNVDRDARFVKDLRGLNIYLLYNVVLSDLGYRGILTGDCLRGDLFTLMTNDSSILDYLDIIPCRGFRSPILIIDGIP